MRNFFSIPNAHTLNPEVVKHFKRNFFANVMDAGFWFFGDSFVAADTISCLSRNSKIDRDA